MFAQHLGHDHLREEDLVDFVQKFPRHLELELRRLVELDPDDQAFSAHFLDERMFRPKRIDAFHQEGAHPRRILDQLLVIEDFERGQPTGHREVVPAERRRMNHAAIHPAESLLISLAPGHDRAAGYVAAAEALRQGDNVRLQIPMFEPEHFASPTESSLDFVADKHRPVLPAKRLGALEEI